MGWSLCSTHLCFPFPNSHPPLHELKSQGCKSHVLGSNAGESQSATRITHGCGTSAKRLKAGGVKVERGVFYNISSPEKIGGAAEHVDERSQEREDEGLIPQQWLTLQDNLHKTKSEKKLEVRLQAIESSMQRAAELQLKRQKLEKASRLPRQEFVHSVDFSLKSLEHAVSPETTARLNIKDAKSGQALPTNKNFFFDSDLYRWFSEDEIADLKRNEPDLIKLNSEKWRPLQVLVASGQFFFLDEFLKSHVDLNCADEDGYAPLHRAVLGRKETAVSQLLRAGADVNVVDKDGASFLHYSVQTGSLSLVKLFVKCGVDVNHSDKNGWTALHVAALTGREDIVRQLLVSGADKHQKTKEGHTPLDLCLASGKGFRTFAVAKNLKRLARENILTAAELEFEEECPTARE